MPFSDMLLNPFSPDDNEEAPTIDLDEEDIPAELFVGVDDDSDPGTTDFVVTDDPTSGIFWVDFAAFNRLEKDRKTYVGGLSSPAGLTGQTVAVVRLANPTTVWVCEWTAAGVGSHPPIPDPSQVGSQWVLLDDDYEVAEVVQMPDGRGTYYRISGTYVFACLSPQEPTILDLVFPRPPWLDPDRIDQEVTEDDLVDGLINSSDDLRGP